MMANKEHTEIVLGTALNPDSSQIINRLTQVVKVSSAYIDCTRRLADFINMFMSVVFGKVIEKMNSSL